MDPRRVASTAAVVAGLGWFGQVAVVWADGGDNTRTGLVAILYFIGLAGAVVALAAAGYTLVERAPVWLRGVVAVATPLLVLMVWSLVDAPIRAVYPTVLSGVLPGGTWLREELSVLLAAAVAIVLGVWGFRRRPERGPEQASRPGRGRRAAR